MTDDRVTLQERFESLQLDFDILLSDYNDLLKEYNNFRSKILTHLDKLQEYIYNVE